MSVIYKIGQNDVEVFFSPGHSPEKLSYFRFKLFYNRFFKPFSAIFFSFSPLDFKPIQINRSSRKISELLLYLSPKYVLFIWKTRQSKNVILDVENSQENNKFVTTVYRKPTFRGVYTHFESSLPSTHKFGMFHTLVYRWCTLCSDWTKFHRELLTLKKIYQRNGYPTSFID